MTERETTSDGSLLETFTASGDEASFNELVRRHGRMVCGVCRRVLTDHHEAEDVAQAVFLTLARKSPWVRRNSDLGGWLHHVARCLAINTLKARVRRSRREEKAMRMSEPATQADARNEALASELDAGIARLPRRYRRPLILFHLEERSLEQTAHALRLNVKTVGTRLVRGREMLRRDLARRGVTVGSVGALTALLSAEAGAAVLPATFVSATVQAAGLAAAGKLAAGVTAGTVSANVAALTKGAVQMILVAKMKMVAAGVVACALAVGTVAVVAQSQAPASRDKAAGGVGVGVGIDESRFKPELSLDLGNGVKMDFVLIRPGMFLMGSDKDSSEEKPVHKVRIATPFYMAKYEVTQEQWETIMTNNPSKYKGAKNLPVTYVSWNDCQEFIKNVNEKTATIAAAKSAENVGPIRLPTEAEWEYACRAGSETKYCFGDSTNASAEYAWFDANSGGKPHPVGEKKPNAWGLYDMHGNVWEPCADWYREYPLMGQVDPSAPSGVARTLVPLMKQVELIDPSGPSSGSYRVRRGGSHLLPFEYSRSTFRGSDLTPDFRGFDFGLRCCCSLRAH